MAIGLLPHIPGDVVEGQNNIHELGRLLRGIRVCMLTTLEPDGSLHSRPMVSQQAEFDGALWFFTRGGVRNQPVNLIYMDSEDRDRFISVSGTAEVIQDPGRARALWSPAYLAWFPRGLEDPDLVLLKVTVNKAEYWDSPAGAGVLLAGFGGLRGEERRVA